MWMDGGGLNRTAWSAVLFLGFFLRDFFVFICVVGFHIGKCFVSRTMYELLCFSLLQLKGVTVPLHEGIGYGGNVVRSEA